MFAAKQTYMVNRFNNLNSKEWLPFQKSWYIEDDIATTYRKNIRFFLKYDNHDELPPHIFFYGNDKRLALFTEIAKEEGAEVFTLENLESVDRIQFAVMDLLGLFETLDDYLKKKRTVFNVVLQLEKKIIHRRFLTIFIENLISDFKNHPIAWDFYFTVRNVLTPRDEKLGCLPKNENIKIEEGTFPVQNNFYYALYFRKDEISIGSKRMLENKQFFKQNIASKVPIYDQTPHSNWFILKPKRRSKDEILHPAKYPEELINIFLKYFTKEGENVFDPMSGTASTQFAALQAGRNGYGTELSPFFQEIAETRLENLVSSEDFKYKAVKFSIKKKDARKITKRDFPTFDYIITSPPYWDMLNMKGAENQAKRRKKGLQTNYSEETNDLGNIEDYEAFLEDLTKIYFKIIKHLKPGGFFTIVVKNIKKKGKMYPLAFDLGRILQKKLVLCPEVFWLQDDINIAPYGYFNTFVTNTFHQYCLTFQVAIDNK